jgi:hypothetical protein
LPGWSINYEGGELGAWLLVEQFDFLTMCIFYFDEKF